MRKQEKVHQIITRLSAAYPDPTTVLAHTNPLELLIATMLSAQTTDKLVNTITPALFAKYASAKDFAEAPVEDIKTLIAKVNFANNKAKHIKAACQLLVDNYNGNVPDTMEELDALPGVARKTANVVLGTAFGKADGIVVDTHVKRLSRRLGLTTQTDPVKIEQDLMKIIPKDQWVKFSHLLILFGREFCPARPHTCPTCPLNDLCPDR